MGGRSGNAGVLAASRRMIDELRATPGAVYAAVGLAFALTSLEAYRYPVAQVVTGDTAVASNTLLVCAMAACGLVWGRGPARGVTQHPSFAAAAGLVGTLSLFSYFTADLADGVPAALWLWANLFFVAGAVLLCCWVCELYRMASAVASAGAFVMAIGVAFALQAVTSVLTPGVIAGTCALFPALSGLFFVLWRHASGGLSALDGRVAEDSFRDAGAQDDQDGEGAGPLRGHIPSIALVAVIALCYGVLFAELHMAWIPNQASWGSTAIQLASASGALVSCLALVAVAPLPNRRISVLTCEALVLAFALFAVCLQTLGSVGALATVYLCSMNAAQKTLLYLLFLVGLLLPARAWRVPAFCALYIAYKLGYLLSRGIEALPAADLAATVAYTVSLAVTIVLLVAVIARPSLLPSLPAELREGHAGDGRSDADDARAETERYKRIAFYFLLGQKYALTQREIELLPLLAQRRGAREVADELAISQATAKTHIRNVYAKFGVHTQADLVAAIDRDRAALFEQLPNW